MNTKIRILSSDIANKIAAGEVVQRPLSVVKELVENAIDANSTKITISLKNSGLEKIIVADNGIGMDQENLKLSLKRHATSKILNEADIFKIMTLGFRGEALASIAAVSKISILTSINGKDGFLLTKNGDSDEKIEQATANKGTTVEVRDLFFNTPARFKHLSSTFYELSLIVAFINKITLANPNIKFELENNENIILKTHGDNNIQNIFSQVYNKDIAKSLKEVTAENNHFKITCYLVKPEFTRSRKNNIYIAINNRIIRNYAIEKMIIDGYGRFLHTNQYPIAYLKIEVDYSLVDVNIHPTKEQIKLSLIDKLEELVVPTIQEAILEEEYIARPHLDLKEEQNEIDNNLYNKNFTSDEKNNLDKIFGVNQEEKNSLNKKDEDNQGKSFSNQEIINQETNYIAKENDINNNLSSEIEAGAFAFMNDLKKNMGMDTSKDLSSKENIEKMQLNEESNKYKEIQVENLERDKFLEKEKQQIQFFDLSEKNKLIPNARYIGTHDNTYLIFENPKGLYLVDQHAAQERIRYEMISNNFQNKKFNFQRLLIPIVFQFTTSEFLNYENDLEYFKNIGLNFEIFGDNTLRLVEADSWYLEMKTPEHDIRKILEMFLGSKKITFDKYIDKVAIMMACKSSIKAHDYITKDDAIDLLNQLGECVEAYTCPHGRPIIVNFTGYELEKMFKRNF